MNHDQPRTADEIIAIMRSMTQWDAPKPVTFTVATVTILLARIDEDAAMLAFLRAVAQATGIVPCTERMPRLDARVMAFDANRRLWRYLEYSDGDVPHWRDEQDDRFHGTISHWYEPSLNLPTPPTECQ